MRYLLLSLALISSLFAYSDDEKYPEYDLFIESIELEIEDDESCAHIGISNGLSFTFYPDSDKQHIFKDINETMHVGDEVRLGTDWNSSKFELEVSVSDYTETYYKYVSLSLFVYLDEQAESSITTVESIKQVGADEYYLKLSDGSYWSSNFYNSSLLEYWSIGERVVVNKTYDNEKFDLINLDADHEHVNFGGKYRGDPRSVYIKPLF